MSAVDPRRAAVLAVAVAALAATAVGMGASQREPEPATGPDRAPVERSASQDPDKQAPAPAHPGPTGTVRERATDADGPPSDAAHGRADVHAGQRLTQTTVPRQDAESAAGDPAAPPALPGTVRAANPPDAETLAAARDVAAAWVLAFTTRDPAEGHDAWLERLRSHSTARLLDALAHPATTEAAGHRPGSVRLLAAEPAPATTDRIGVRVRFTLDLHPAEHALEVVVVPTGDGPRVDELRL